MHEPLYGDLFGVINLFWHCVFTRNWNDFVYTHLLTVEQNEPLS